MSKIYSCLHKVRDIYVDSKDTEHPELVLENIPHMVVSQSLLDLMIREDLQDSIQAMIDCGICKLPFSYMLLEFSVTPSVYRFVYLVQAEEKIVAKVFQYFSKRDVLLAAENTIDIEIKGNKLDVKNCVVESDHYAAVLAACIALLTTNIRGVDKEVIGVKELSRFNKNRRIHGKATLSEYTYLRIGSVYDYDGKVIGGGHKSVRVHLRKGFVRNQACGTGLKEHRLIYVEPVLVNYKPGSETPRRKIKLTA